MNRIVRDTLRLTGLMATAALLVKYSAPFAQSVNEPAYAAWGLFAGLALFGVTLAHFLRRALFPYIDMKEVAHEARSDPWGSGIVFLGVCIVLAAFIMLLGNVAHAGPLPANATTYLPILKAEQQAYWPAMPLPSALGAQVEQETCVKLTSPRCWSPRAELKTAREQGTGLGQITRTDRFDALAEIVSAHRAELAGWRWDSPELYNPTFQLRALVLKNLQNWRAIGGAASDYEHLAFMFAAYNGGAGGVMSDRQVCKGTKGCDSRIWFGQVENTSLKARAVSTGYGQSFFHINRTYTRNVLIARRSRYMEVLP